ncbi:MAG: iron ABC transporter permease [Candidatus Adiutrix sp.]|jgi:iron(III) transport system permease protein|nr:iron ABC transporter permease [Candidatus Adiutrix sp.]
MATLSGKRLPEILPGGWSALRALAALAVALPFGHLLASARAPGSENWPYVRDYLLPSYFGETLILAAGSSLAALGLGVLLAWLISRHDFWGKTFFDRALILPLAIPPYIAAYAYDGLLGYTGPVQTFLRNRLGLAPGSFRIDLPPLAWAIFIFSITLFPYVYLLSRAFLIRQSAALFENAEILGRGEFHIFRKIGWPLMLPTALAGLTLVLLEVLNDFGVASYFGLNTFTTAIFSAWFGMGDSGTAIKLAVILMIFVFAVLLLRRLWHRAARYQIVSSREKPFRPRTLSGPRQAPVILFCWLALTVSFLLPLAQMFYWLSLTLPEALNRGLGRAAGYTLFTALTATAAIMLFAVATVNANRLFSGRLSTLLSRLANVGYSIPSAVLAIGVITFFINLDRQLKIWRPDLALTISMTSAMLIFALSIRFFTVGCQAVEAGFAKIGPIYTEASRSLGHGVTKTFFLVDLPLIRQAVLSGAILVFIDLLKELPLSLILRPFNSETLGSYVHHFVNNEVLEETAAPSLLIILTGAVFILLMRRGER